jgi:protein gp37
MSDNSTVEWLNKPGYKPATWNPTVGCKRVSPGCDNCYPIPLARIREKNPNPKIAAAFAGVVERTGDRLDWTGQVNLLPDRLDTPLHWRLPRMVFVNSLSDLFHDAIPDEFIAKVFAVMAQTSRHLYVILTKRHARMRSLLSSAAFIELVQREVPADGWPLRNVILGVSVENQKWADIRIPALLETPAAVRCASAEPLLGQLDLDRWLRPSPGCGLGWVICGGESGHGARPMHPDWPRSLRDQCTAAGVSFFFKQYGEWAPYGEGEPTPAGVHGAIALVSPDGRTHSPRLGTLAPAESVRMARYGKHRSGAVLDGQTWTEYPDA